MNITEIISAVLLIMETGAKIAADLQRLEGISEQDREALKKIVVDARTRVEALGRMEVLPPTDTTGG